MIEWVTWEFFTKIDGSDFIENFQIFDEKISNWLYDPLTIHKHAQNYSEDIFEEKIRTIVWK
jgi:hypothetical protein